MAVEGSLALAAVWFVLGIGVLLTGPRASWLVDVSTPAGVADVKAALWPGWVAMPNVDVDDPGGVTRTGSRTTAWFGDESIEGADLGGHGVVFNTLTVSDSFSEVFAYPVQPGTVALDPGSGPGSRPRLVLALVVAGGSAVLCWIVARAVRRLRRTGAPGGWGVVALGGVGITLLVATPAVVAVRYTLDRALLERSVFADLTAASPWTAAHLWPAAVGLLLLMLASARSTATHPPAPA